MTAIARQRLKRALLDKLAERYDFPVPPGMVEMEFNNIWQQYEARRSARDAAAGSQRGRRAALTREETAEASRRRQRRGGRRTRATPSAAKLGGAATVRCAEPRKPNERDEEARRPSIAAIAERRVRLGLLLAEVGRNNNITVTQDELNQALIREARRHPGYERQVIDYYRQNPEALSNLRAPIFEDKVVDFIVELAKLDERKVSPQELLAGAEAGRGGGTPARRSRPSSSRGQAEARRTERAVAAGGETKWPIISNST